LKTKKIAVYGRGEAGRQLIEILLKTTGLQIVFVVDDNIADVEFLSIPCITPIQLKKYISKVDEIYFSISAINTNRRVEILDFLTSLAVPIKVIPQKVDLLKHKIDLRDLEQMSFDDLIGRIHAQHDVSDNLIHLVGKKVMVTGGGGSIGATIVKKLLNLEIGELIIVDQSEYNLYVIMSFIESISPDFPVSFSLEDISDPIANEKLFEFYRPQYVIHAAAYKHVKIGEINPTRMLANNVFGTRNCVVNSIKYSVESFLLISTDKAVRPSSIMGCSKRISELIVQAYSMDLDQHKIENENTTKFSSVRFGNVLGSSGSVVPKFISQIKNGGPLTVTDSNVTRYLMTLSEAADLVLLANSLDSNGDIFLLDMGKPIKIVELAKKLIRSYGFVPFIRGQGEGNFEILITGLGEGEKMYEELLIKSGSLKTEYDFIYKATDPRLKKEKIDEIIQQLTLALSHDTQTIKQLLAKIGIGYSGN
jgi:UDP-N-acetylglucosamine 4,6-dehydratase